MRYIPLLHLTQHIRYGLTSLSFGTLLPSVATSYILIPLCEIAVYIIGDKYDK